MSNDTTQHIPADVRELAVEIIRSLDLIARNYDSYEYGLPVMTHYDEMVDTVVALLRTPRGEGESARRDEAQEEKEDALDLIRWAEARAVALEPVAGNIMPPGTYACYAGDADEPYMGPGILGAIRAARRGEGGGDGE